jgi:uncharacterized protein YsxB (DUF464 family)
VIEIRVRLDKLECLQAFRASGHARAAGAGEDIVCAAVTVLLRTCARLLSDREKRSVVVKAPEPGELSLVLEPPPERIEWLRGVTDFLLAGIAGLQSEYPDRLTVHIIKER